MNVTETVNSINSIEHNIPIVAGRIFSFVGYALLVILAILCCFVVWMFIQNKIETIRAREQRDREWETEKAKIVRYLKNKKIKELNTKSLEKFIEEIEETIARYRIADELKNKLMESEQLLKIRKGEEDLRNIELKKEAYEEFNQKLEEEGSRLMKKNEDMRTEREDILKFLGADENNVFIMRKLNKKQIKVLSEEGYKHSNQYSAEDNKIVSVLIKPPLNHTPAHTFLVWSIRKLLKKIKGAEEIRDHDTRGPDVTFEYNDEDYAIEVETGSLLRKKHQLNEKLKYLDKNYSNRWMFVVSHRTLLGRYKKYGMTSNRVQVLENIKKMLKNNIRIF